MSGGGCGVWVDLTPQPPLPMPSFLGGEGEIAPLPDTHDPTPDAFLMIECHELTKQFGTYTAVNRFTFSVADGELFGFLGPNGAGKTTTIKMLTGLLRPTSGTASIGGYDIEREPLLAKKLFGYIPDNPFLYEKLTGREYLDLMSDLYGVVHRDRAGRITDLLRLFDLEEKGREMIQGYSRGMRQKISLAGALIHAPKLILLDEPTVGLDPRGSRTMRDILTELTRRGVTVFISTHILEVAEKLCDRVAIVNRGEIVALGSVEEVKAHALATGDFPPDHAPTLEEVFLTLTGDTPSVDLAQYLDE